MTETQRQLISALSRRINKLSVLGEDRKAIRIIRHAITDAENSLKAERK